MEEHIADKNALVYLNGKLVTEIPQLEAEALVEDWNLGEARADGNIIALQISDEDYEKMQQFFDRVSEVVKTLAEKIAEMMKSIAEQLSPVIKDMIEKLDEALGGWLSYQAELRSVATPKQWHLYMYGRPRVSKKWLHIFEKRLARQRKGVRRREI